MEKIRASEQRLIGVMETLSASGDEKGASQGKVENKTESRLDNTEKLNSEIRSKTVDAKSKSEALESQNRSWAEE